MTPAPKNSSPSYNPTPRGSDTVFPTTTPRRPIWEIIVELGAQISEEEWAKVPDDASINYKHYLYGAPPKSL
jgi:hypothetical protein